MSFASALGRVVARRPSVSFSAVRCVSTARTGRFAGKTAIVTGGASGIGLATVRRLCEDGAMVAIFDVNTEASLKAVSNLRKQGHGISSFDVDVSSKEACLRGVKDFADFTDGKINFLVNNAVYFGSQGLQATDEDWHKSLFVNVVGFSNMVQACHPYMLNAGGNGCAVVNMASVSAHRAQPIRWTYSSTKGAIAIMTKTMAMDLSVDGIRVNSLSPAWIWTPEVAKAAQGDREKWEPIWGPFHMLRRFGEASEVASAAAFLLSDDATFITGTDLPVDGGYMAMGPEGLGEKSVFAGTSDDK